MWISVLITHCTFKSNIKFEFIAIVWSEMKLCTEEDMVLIRLAGTVKGKRTISGTDSGGCNTQRHNRRFLIKTVNLKNG